MTMRYSRLAVCDVALHFVDIDLTDRLGIGRAVHMNVHDVLCDSLQHVSLCTIETKRATDPIALLVVLILDDEDHVETGQNRRLEINVL